MSPAAALNATATVDRRALGKALDLATLAIPSRAVLPITVCARIEATGGVCELRTTNLDVALAVSFPCPADLPPMCVPAKLLDSFVGGVEGKEITLGERNKKLTLTAGKASANLNTMDPDEFPPSPTLDKDAWEASVPASQLRVALEQVVKAAAHDDSRPVLAGVHFGVAEGVLTLAAVDGFRLAVRSLPLEGAAPLDRTVPASTIRLALKLLDDEDDEPAILVFTPNHFHLATGTARLTSRLIEGTFPNYATIIPKDSATWVTLDVAQLRQAVRATAPMADGKHSPLKLRATPEGLAISSVRAEVGDASAFVDCAVDGDGLEIGVDEHYLVDVLAACPDGELRIGLKMPTTPLLFVPEGEPGLNYVVMPIHLMRPAGGS